MSKLKFAFFISTVVVSMAALTGTRYHQVVGQLGEGEFSKEKLLLNIALNIVKPEVEQFQSEILALDTAVTDYCSAIGSDSDNVALENVKQQWKTSMLSYHRLDSVAFGPLIENGRFLADNFYSWPLMNTCGVDKAVDNLSVSGIYDPKIIFTSKGLGALEYIFFEETYGSTCNLNNARNKHVADWLKKPLGDRKSDRCSYAKMLTQELIEKADILVQAWDASGGNYPLKLVDNTSFANLDGAINHISDGLFSIEYMKDFRLGKPMGLHKECISPNKICPDQAEHLWSGISLEAMEVQALGFRKAFFGSDDTDEMAFGFDDYLTSVGHARIATEVKSYIEKVLQDIDHLKAFGDLHNQISDAGFRSCAGEENTSGTLCSLFNNIRGITTLMKSDVLIALSLQAPPTFQGDND